jgi:hypothetical protein
MNRCFCWRPEKRESTRWPQLLPSQVAPHTTLGWQSKHFFIRTSQSHFQTSDQNIIHTSLRIDFSHQNQFIFDPALEMIHSPHHLLIFYFAQPSIAVTNLIQALNFQPQNPQSITMRPTLKLRNPTFPEPTTPPSPAQLLQQNSACQLVGEALAICNTLTPGFDTLQPTDQAHCLCYSSTSWMPGIFDGAVKTCADYASTAVPGAFPPLSNLEGFCQSIGDVESPAPTFAITTMYQTISMSISVSAFPGQPCNSVNQILNSCSSLTPGFSSLQPKDQASCLCYVSTSSWCPTAFDNAVGTCAVYAQTAAPSVYSALTGLEGFCASVGDMMTPASYSVATTLSAVASATLSNGPSSTKGVPGGGTSTTTELATTITIGGERNTETAKSGELQLQRWSEGEVVGFSFFCALLVLFL